MRSAALSLVVLGMCACGGAEEGPPAVGTLERDRIELTAEANEPIVEIAVREGDRVSAGAVLVRLEERRLRAELDAARAERDRAGARLAELERGPREERVAEARAQLAAARSAAFAARRELDRVRELARRDVASAARLDDAEGMHAEAVARRDQARAALDALLHGTTAEELAQARNAVAAAEAARAATEVRFERLTVRAPSAGEIDALPFELGERPPAGAVVAVLLAEGAPYARVYVPAELRIRVQPGGRARVRIDGRAEPLEGRVRTVARDPAFTPYFALTEHDRSRLAYVAEIVLEGAEAARLPAGIPVEARFEPAGLATRRADGS